LRFLKSEARHLVVHRPWLLPSAAARTALKLSGFRLGLLERHLP